MRLGVFAISTMTGIALTSSAAATARAQLSIPRPTIQRPTLNLAAAASPGTGTFATSIVPAANQNTQPLGNATSVTFTNPTAGSGQSGLAVQHQAGTLQIQYPANDQLAGSLARLPCAMSGCVIPEFKIQTQVGPNTMTWDIRNLVVTQLQMSPAISVGMKYEKMMLTTTTAQTGNGSNTPAHAAYKLGTAKTS